MTDLEIGFKLFDQMVTFWQFYVGGLIGVAGWVFSREHAWPSEKRFGIAVTFLMFSLINMSALYKTTSGLTDISIILNSQNYQLAQGITKSIFEIAANRLNVGDWSFHIEIKHPAPLDQPNPFQTLLRARGSGLAIKHPTSTETDNTD